MTQTMTTVTVDGPVGELHVYRIHRQAAGTPVLFLHPLNTAGEAWLEVASLLHRPAAAVDLRGHGRSTGRGPYGVEDYADDALAVMDALDMDHAHLVGASIGGAIAVAVAARAPERVVSIAAFGSALSLDLPPAAIEEMARQVRAAGVREFLGPQAQAVIAPGSEPRIAERLLDLAVGPPSARRGPDLVAAVLRDGFAADVRDQVDKVRCPALVVAGEHDPTCPPAAAAQLAAALHVEPTPLSGVGHLPMLERPATVADLVRNHIAAVES